MKITRHKLQENIKDDNYRELYLDIYHKKLDYYESNMENSPEFQNLLDTLSNQVKEALKQNKINIPHYNKLMFQIYGDKKHNYGKS